MDVIPIDARLVKGSHGRANGPPEHGPVFLSSQPGLLPEWTVATTAVKDLLLGHVFADP